MVKSQGLAKSPLPSPRRGAVLSGSKAAQGRPNATSHAEIERVAFDLFSARGFEATTLDAIAEQIGVSRRTVTRYYGSKNDIPWGRFDRTLVGFEQLLGAMPTDVPLWERVHRAVVEFNRFPGGAVPSHRERMRLILHTPTLLAHSVLRYEEWRSVIAAYVAVQTEQAPTAALPQLAGHVSLALAVATYEQWLAIDGGDNALLLELLDATMADLRRYLA